jgi:hypothetical protein
MPTQLKKLKMKNGHKNDSMVTLVWKDKGVLLMFDTYHNVDTQREERVVGRGVRWQSSPRLCVTSQHILGLLPGQTIAKQVTVSQGNCINCGESCCPGWWIYQL